MKLRPLIKTTFNEYILESYSNIHELKTLTNDIIHLMTKDIVHEYNILDSKYIIYNIFKNIDIKKYHDIQDFIKDNFVKSIEILTISNNKFNGGYLDNKIKLIINISVNNLKILTSKDEASIYYLLNGSYSTLLHELQHAYDDYRSNGKFIKSDINYNYNNNKDLEKYHKSNHELNAYFTSTISEIVFYDIDYEETPTILDDGLAIIIKKINDFDIIKQDFIKKFKGWRYLTEDIKKKMLHRLGKYYISVNENIQKYNQEKHTKDFGRFL